MRDELRCRLAEALDRVAPDAVLHLCDLAKGRANRRGHLAAVDEWLVTHRLASPNPLAAPLMMAEAAVLTWAADGFPSQSPRLGPIMRARVREREERTKRQGERERDALLAALRGGELDPQSFEWADAGAEQEHDDHILATIPRYEPGSSRTEWRHRLAAWSDYYLDLVDARQIPVPIMTAELAAAMERARSTVARVTGDASPPDPALPSIAQPGHHFDWFVLWQVRGFNTSQLLEASERAVASPRKVRAAVGAVANALRVPLRKGRPGRPKTSPA